MANFFNDLVHGNFSDIWGGIKAHPWKAAGEAAAAAAAVAAPWAIPAIGSSLGLGALGVGAADAGAASLGAASASAPLDILAGGSAAGTAGLGTLGSLVPADAAAGAALAPDLTDAGLSGWPGALPGISPGATVGLGTSSPLSFAGSSASPVGSSLSSAGAPSIISTGTSGSLGGGASGLDALAYGNSPLDLSAPTLGGAPSVATPSPGFGSDALGWLKSNPGLAASLGIGGASLLKGLISPSKLPNQDQLSSIAAQAGSQAGSLSAQGQALLGPIQGGPLPPGLEAQVTQGLRDAISTTQSRYAALGLSGSTMEADQIAKLQESAVIERGKLAMNLAQEGNALISQSTTDLGIEAGIYQDLMKAQVSQDDQLSASIAQFAGASANAFATQHRPVYNVNATKAT